MTQQKHFKQLVRARMAKTGERYAAARRTLIGAAGPSGGNGVSAAGHHFPGNVPATAALRSLLAAAGLTDPTTGAPYTETMLFGLAGGIGIGVCAFLYEQQDFASFFVAGRHLWWDDRLYLERACKRLGVEAQVFESGGAKAADTALRNALAGGRPAIVWVDAGNLPHRAMPPLWDGGGYYVVTVHRIDDAEGVAYIGDLADDLIPIPLAGLAAARGRIKKFKNRLLTVAPPVGTESVGDPSLQAAISDALRACHAGLEGADAIGSKAMFSLGAVKTWADRMHGGKDKERWEVIFTPGRRLWAGLTSINDFIEHYGTGGGLCRPLFAEFLIEAASRTGDARLKSLGEQYAQLGRDWSALADAALPEGVPMFEEAQELLARKAELLHTGAAPGEVAAVWADLGKLVASAADRFPLDNKQCDALRAALQERIAAIHADEAAAHAELGGIVG